MSHHPWQDLVVLMDCDGVWSNYVDAIVERLRRKFRRRLILWSPNPDVWDLFEDLPKEVMEFGHAQSMSKGFVLGLEECAGAKEGVASLVELPGISLHVVTTAWPKAPFWLGERTAWVAARHPELSVTFAPHKWLVDGDVLIDDKYSTLVLWKARYPKGVAILWKAAWNRPYWYSVNEAHVEMGASQENCPSGRRATNIEICNGWTALKARIQDLAAEKYAKTHPFHGVEA